MNLAMGFIRLIKICRVWNRASH